ncbi:class I SAM-dependent methyltransferase [Candidatus Shapirobacteria bacterium]|nr:class I SAM-dependent methyltransferase [Candidatus Shapirobacteria bacterium]
MKIIKKLRNSAVTSYEKNILDFTERNNNHRFLDCGCDDGKWTKKVINKGNFSPENSYGIEIIKNRALAARKRGIKVRLCDLNRNLPYKDNFFDLVHANQVIEHLYDTNHFLSEIYRVTKKGGYIIICTENLSSWHNIFSLFFGFQPFSLTNVSSKFFGIGNPLSPHYREAMKKPNTWQHIRVFAYRGLVEHIQEAGFKIESIKGSGYYPINILSKIDPRHSAFLTVKGRKL